MGERKQMIVEGYALPAEIEDGALAWLRQSSAIKAYDVVRHLLDLGVPREAVNGSGYSPAYRIADRLLQRERKAGRIAFSKGAWSAVTPPPGAGG